MQKLFFLLGILLLFSCVKNNQQATELTDGISYQLLAFDDTKKTSSNKEFVSASLQLVDGDSLLFNRFHQHTFAIEGELFITLFSVLKPGDSAVFNITPQWITNHFFELQLPAITNDTLRLYIKVNQYFSEEEHQIFLKERDDDLVEHEYITWYVNRFFKSEYIKRGGVYIFPINKTDGKKVAYGDFIRIKYNGYFLNHVPLDQAAEGTILDFEYGTPNQVVKGINIAIKGMRVGEKVKIIVPSQLAFGEYGSSTGIVPPKTPLIFNLELSEIMKSFNQ
jgi:hypothetical protein